jgi:hypothetical protein
LAAVDLKVGANARHGPHQGAQKSTTTGIELSEINSLSMAGSAVTGPSSKGLWHFPQFGASANLLAGARLRCAQCGHLISMMAPFLLSSD